MNDPLLMLRMTDDEMRECAIQRKTAEAEAAFYAAHAGPFRIGRPLKRLVTGLFGRRPKG